MSGKIQTNIRTLKKQPRNNSNTIHRVTTCMTSNSMTSKRTRRKCTTIWTMQWLKKMTSRMDHHTRLTNIPTQMGLATTHTIHQQEVAMVKWKTSARRTRTLSNRCYIKALRLEVMSSCLKKTIAWRWREKWRLTWAGFKKTLKNAVWTKKEEKSRPRRREKPKN